MTRSEIEAFFAVVRYGSISTAADRLYVTQPALSRRLRNMEAELGYVLFLRDRGMRSVTLTEEGQAFLPIAGKLLRAWQEAAAIPAHKQKPVLRLASIGSVSTYLLPPVLRQLLDQGNYSLSFQNLHSVEAYAAIEEGAADLALISNYRYARTVRTVPLWREPFVLLGGPEGQGAVSPESLNPADEIRLPWNPEFDTWHDRWFDAAVQPRVQLDQMSLMEAFLVEDSWAVAPLTVAYGLRKRIPLLRPLSAAPADRIVYYLTREDGQSGAVKSFLSLLEEQLRSVEGVRLEL